MFYNISVVMKKILDYIKWLFDKKEYKEIPVGVKFSGIDVDKKLMYKEKAIVIEFYKFLVKQQYWYIMSYDKAAWEVAKKAVRDFVISAEKAWFDVKLLGRVI